MSQEGRARGWTDELPNEALQKDGGFTLIFQDQMGQGLALSPIYGEQNASQNGAAKPRPSRWGISLAKRSRPGYSRVMKSNAVFNKHQLLALRAWIDEQLE